MYRFFIFYCIFISSIEMYKTNNTKNNTKYIFS